MEKSNNLDPQDIKLVQPNKVTNARYNYSAREENILTLIIEALQGYMTRQQEMNCDLFGDPCITLNLTQLGETSRKSDYLYAAKNLLQKTIAFEWNHPDYKQKIETDATLIAAVHNFMGSPIIQITLNKWAIPYLLYWGKGVGGTIYNGGVAIALKGEYTKRLYKLCKRFQDNGGFTIQIEKLRNMFGLDDQYKKINDFKRRILDPAKKRMEENADIYFNYTMVKIKSRAYNQINFTIHSNNKNLSIDNKNEMYQLVYTVINYAYPNTQSSKARDLTDLLSQDPAKLEKIYHRFKRIQAEFYSHEKELKDVIPLVKYILKNDYKLI